MTQDTFFEPVYVKGQRRRWEADVDWTVGPGVGARRVHHGDRRSASSRGSATTT